MTVYFPLGPDCAFALTRRNGSRDKNTRWILNMLLIELDSQFFGKWANVKKIPKSPKSLAGGKVVIRSE